MAELPLELHRVLEDEYVSMYGPLEKSSADYDVKQILDDRWARIILDECGIAHAGRSVAQVLNDYVGGRQSLEPFAKSHALSETTRELLVENQDCDEPETRRRLIDEAMKGTVTAQCDIRLEKVYSAIHQRAKNGKHRTALCISGGGVRSATFGLGIIQGMASANLLEKFNYLSTVSGGGYMGSWLSSWVRRHPQGVTGVQSELQRADTAVSQSQQGNDTVPRQRPDRKLFPEPTPLRHLREFSSYLSPKLSVFSGDTWTMIALYLRNLLLNLLVLVPLLALVLAFPRMFSFVLQKTQPVLQPVAWAWIGAGLITWAFAYIARKRPIRQGREGKPTSDGWFILNCILPLVGASTALSVYYARTTQDSTLLRSPQGIAAAFTALAGMSIVPFAIYYFRYFRTTAAERRTGYTDGGARSVLLKIGAELFAATVAMGTTAALLFFVTDKLFENPINPIPTTATLAPIERAVQSATPVASLFLCLSVPLLLLVFFVQGSIFVGLSGKFNEDSDREWWGRAGAWLLLFGIGLAVFNVLAVFGPVAFYHAPYWIAGTGGVAGAIAAGLGYGDKTSAKKKAEKSKSDTASSLGAALTVPLFVAIVLVVIAVGTTMLGNAINVARKENTFIIDASSTELKRQAVLEAKYAEEQGTAPVKTTLSNTGPRVITPELQGTAHLQVVQTTTGTQILVFLGLAAFSLIMSTFIGVNRFSLHAFYRNRMIRGYLGASRYDRDPDDFTGFDEHDNLQLWELRPELLWPVQIEKAVELVKAMQDASKSVPNRLWKLLDDNTCNQLVKAVNGVSIEGLVLNLNVILLGDDLATKLGVTEPAWVQVKDNEMPYPQAIRNRATLDAYFSEWITVMVPPADSKGPVPDMPADAHAPAPKLKVNGGQQVATAQKPVRKQSRAPLHVLNGALNLTTGENLAWQERKAAAFSMSPYHSGSFIVGYRSSREYGGHDGISLGTAATISGAAASPNMGYASSPALAFLLTFFNLRLGIWLGNPGPAGDATYTKTNPRSGLVPMFAELTGNSNAKHAWVNLSDGGHFDNLGLYEMVLRRCHQIVVSDAGADPKCTFEDLGAAIRKIRIDFGIPIDIESVKEMHPRTASPDGKPVKGDYVLTGTIRYDAVDANAVPGRLVYIKPGLYDHPFLPVDVYTYATSSPTFPHESTADQFYSESQFESYRALARHAIDLMSGNQRLDADGDAATPPSPTARWYETVKEFPAQH